jgi:hypothetical protein
LLTVNGQIAFACGVALSAQIAASCGGDGAVSRSDGAGGGAGGAISNGGASGTGASDGGTAASGGSGTLESTTVIWDVVQPRQADVLLVIDNSSSGAPAQATLKASLPAFMNVLKGLPGGLLDLHIGVVTSDMGAGDGSSILGCSREGDNGLFQYKSTGGCSATGLDASATFISDTGGAAPTTNFGSNDITSVLQCLVMVGGAGCGFVQPLGAAARAVGADGYLPPPGDQGFLRPDAPLAVILVSSQDDCSGPTDNSIFNPTSSVLASMYGPTQKFLCNEWGHKCLAPSGPSAGQYVQPSRYAPNNSPNDVVTYSPAAGPSNCESFEDSAVMTSIRSVADGLMALKSVPTLVTVAALAGPPFEYAVTWRSAPVTDTGPWPSIKHSCVGASASLYADPAVRLSQFVQTFGDNGFFGSYCQTDFSAPLQAIATKLAQLALPVQCLGGKAAKKAGSTATDCTVFQSVPNPNNPQVPITTAVPMCDGSGTVPCWTIEPAAPAGQTCVGGHIEINYGGVQPAANTKARADCTICPAGVADPAHGC